MVYFSYFSLLDSLDPLGSHVVISFIFPTAVTIGLETTQVVQWGTLGFEWCSGLVELLIESYLFAAAS